MKPESASGPADRPPSGRASFPRDVAVIGGGGHVGLPLALTFAEAGLRTVIYDSNRETVAKIRGGTMPFTEEGAQELLERALLKRLLEVNATPEFLSECRFLILVIGTPVDEHLKPTFTAMLRAIDSCSGELRNGQILILRSTIFPGISAHVQKDLEARGLEMGVAFCPERVAEGRSLREFRELPQIVSAFRPETVAAVKELFGRFTPEFIEMTPMEAELCKLMTNASRYIQFAIANQFYTIARDHGLDFDRILHGCRHNYPRMAGMPGPGFAAGPCLLKDTMQLAAFSQNSFLLGHSAMLVNEGLPGKLVELARREVGLSGKTTGILGMAFKAESDDPRDSLSYKLRNLLTLESRRVLCTDPYVRDPSLTTLERVLSESDVLFLATPHRVYRGLRIPEDKPLFDVWSWIPRR
ncbi:MAG TPA: nucleotide sugar dehydrogenase [Thermoanaerobaculia bacterium]|nr:nucleotide sugar dehydrogenase [Thermoanaerobaculia bacterium]